MPFDPASPAPLWTEEPFLVLDTETTSPDPLTARLVSVAAIYVAPDGTTDGYEAIVDAGVDVPDEAAAIHGITTARVRAEGVPLVGVMAALIALFTDARERGIPIVIYNVPFDWTVCFAEAARAGLRMPSPPPSLIDVLLLDRHFDKWRKGSRKLADVAAAYGVPVGAAHDASADALMTAGILRALVARKPILRQLSLPTLMSEQVKWWRAWKLDVNAYWTRVGKPQRATGDWPLHPGA